MLTAGHKQLKNLSMEKTLNAFPIDVCYEVSGSKSGVKSRRTLVDFHNEMMHCVNVRIAEVNSNSSYSKSETSWTATNNYWSIESVD